MGNQIKTGYKQSELGEIPQDWQVVELVEVCDIDTENLTSNTNLDYEFDYIPLEQVDNGKLLRTERYKFKDAPSRARRILRKNDVLISTVRPNLMSHYYVKNEVHDLICSTGFSVVREVDNLIMPYLYHHLFANIINRQITLIVVGSNYPAINNRDVKSLQIPLPPKPEQTAIATALSDTDALIDHLKDLIAKKQSVKTATMQTLLTGKTRLPAFAARSDGTPKQMVKTEYGEVPEDWEVAELGTICNIQKGELITEDSKKFGNIPVIAGGKKPAYFYDVANRFGKTITISASGANAGFVNFFKIPIFASDCSTISENEIFCIEFIYYNLLNIQTEIYAMQTGGAQPHVQPSDLRSLLIVIPEKTEQIAIAQILSDMESDIAALESRLQKIQSLKQGMMQHLLSGKIRLPFAS